MPPAAPDAALGPSRSLGPVLGALEAAPPAAASAPAPLNAPLPPKREVASVDDWAPLPPARPTEFAALELPAPAATDKALAYAAPRPPSRRRRAGENVDLLDLQSAADDDRPAMMTTPPSTRFPRARSTCRRREIEAHRGLGEYMDDPNHVDEHLRGATPPDLYDLQPRELLFHGVAAIWLVPVGGDGAVYGREGLLAHPFMMGDNGDSNGCVSIKDYDAFLKAFQDGKVTRLAVVAKL